MNIDLLIREVFKRNPLWDQKDLRHHNRFVLDKMWDEVAVAMKSTRKAVRVKWKSLRDNYRKELQKMPHSGDDGSQTSWESSWKYFESLHFIKDQFSPRFAGESLLEVTMDSAVATDSVDIKSSIPIQEDFNPEDAHSHSSVGTSASLATRKRKRPTDDIDNPLIRIERRLEMLEKNQTQSEKVDDDVAFFNSLLPYVRPIAHVDKLLLRIQMQQLIYDFVKSAAQSQ